MIGDVTIRRLFSFFILLCLAAAAQLRSQPKLRIEEGLQPDFGDIYTNEVLQKSLHLVNDGNDTLVISGVSASCGCTSVLASSDHIPPQGTGEVKISFNPERFSGPQTKAISFETNDPRMPHAHIDFSVHIKKVLEISREYLTFPSAHVDSQSIDELIIKNVSAAPVKILAVTTTSPFMYVTPVKTTIRPNDSATLTCMFLPKSRGLVRGNIVIETDNILVPKISTRFFALVKAAPGAGGQHN